MNHEDMSCAETCCIPCICSVSSVAGLQKVLVSRGETPVTCAYGVSQ